MRKTAVVICPGRGTYTKTELGYLSGRRHIVEPLIGRIDAYLASLSEPTVTALDGAASFSLKTHTPGEYASLLIYACSAADFAAIDREQIDIVAVTGNSMGWYSALALSGALSADHSVQLIHTMGSMMRGGIIGGQLIYPVVAEDWRPSSERRAMVDAALTEVKTIDGCEAYPSIRFGGYAIIGGNDRALKYLMGKLPPADDGRYPFILVNHAAFHTPMLKGISQQAMMNFSDDFFQAPELPLIDGRGVIWQPYSTDPQALRQYTLGHQVYETYDFSLAVSVALKEFAPDYLILLGPGSSSGGAIGQILIENHWLKLKDKDEFAALQSTAPFLLAMGREEQARVIMRPSDF